MSFVVPNSTSTATLGVTLSPDASPVVNLTLYDANASDLYNEAISLAKTLFPNWKPQAGNTEVALLQSLATIVSEDIFAINRLPVTVVQSLLLLAGITPSVGSQATATATFNLTDNANGVTIAAGTSVQLQMSEGRAFTFVTQQNTYVPAATLAATVGIICTDYTSTPNNTAAGTYLSVPSVGVLSVTSVQLATEVLGGADPESVQSWVLRGSQVLQRLSSTLVSPSQFQQAALSSDTTVWRCRVTNNWDPTAASSNGASALGHVTVSVYGKSNPLNPGSPSPVAPDHKTALLNVLSEQAQANLTVHVVDATVTSASVTAVVQRKANFAAADVQLAVQQAVYAWMSSDSWLWDGTIRYNQLLRVIEDSPGVDFASYVTVNNTVGDIELAGIAALANAASVTCTVLDPSTVPTNGVTVDIFIKVHCGANTPATVQSAVASAVTSWANGIITGAAAGAAAVLSYAELLYIISTTTGVTGMVVGSPPTITAVPNGAAAPTVGTTGDLTIIGGAATLGSVSVTAIT